MKRRIVTFAGRQETLEILYPQLKREYEKKEFDEWYLLENTWNIKDLEYIEELEKKEDFITIKRLSKIEKKIFYQQYLKGWENKLGKPVTDETCFPSYLPQCGHYSFRVKSYGKYAVPFCLFTDKEYSDEDVIYIKIDDDIIFVEEGALTKLINFKLKHPEYLFVYGNIVNNPVTNDIYFKLNIYKNNDIHSYNKEIENLHRTFIKKIKEKRTKDFYFPNQEINKNIHFHINVMCWLGKDFKKHHDSKLLFSMFHDEIYLSKKICERANLNKGLCGNALFSHYSYWPQLQYLSKTNILKKYKKYLISSQKPTF